ncbi:hypothetical protein WISP_62232 [Willisornis vidua]|uniref:Uncharacterized protein n=1 Tax=Willisornis vidua TaxID=1566151 RepID=A0ABQ9DFD1_9PASS|nr:hypothetical protein WISP_62232 [Willisornis vidua]
MPDRSQMDLLLAKAQATGDGGSTFGITDLTDLRNSKMPVHREKQLCRYKAQEKKRGRRCCRCQDRDSPAACGTANGETAVPLRPEIHLQHMGDPTLEQVDVPEVGCDPVRSLCWDRFLACGP